MGKAEAKVRGVLRALTCVLVASCGGPDGTTSDDDDVRFTNAELSREGAAALEAARCASYRDEPSTVVTNVTIRNDRVSPIYLVRQPSRAGCHVSALFAVTHDGVRLDVHGFADCAHRSCERLQDEGLAHSSCVDECADEPRLLRLEPGVAIAAGVLDGEYVSHGAPSSAAMPASCIADEPDAEEGVACVSKRALARGRYRLSARAFGSLECDGEQPCECARRAVGWCLLDRTHQRRGPVLEAVEELELPEEQVTLSFREP